MHVMVCPRCATENEGSNRFCGRCGLEFAQVVASNPSDTEGQMPCYKHKNEMTLLHCGRCDRPICTRCVIIGPAGPRCKDCARHNLDRSKTVIAETGLGIRRFFRSGPMSIWMWLVIITIGMGLVRGCSAMFRPRPGAEPSYEQDEVPIESPRPAEGTGTAI